MDCPMIRISGVSRRFGEVEAVREATLAAGRGEVVALLGPSGCGKTTLLRLVAGFEVPHEGEIELAGARVAGAGSWVPPERRRLGMVFQDYALFPHLTVAENVGFGVARSARAARAAELLALVGLEELGDRYPHTLSGGQQQRVALARALAPAPAAILLDEPWSSIDPDLRGELRQEVAGILRPLEVTVILVTHDREEAFSLADRVALMREGTIVQEGTPEELYRRPRCRWAAGFVGPANFVRGPVAAGLVRTPLGAFPAGAAAAAASAEVLVRPELLELAPDEAGGAVVVGREFRGHDVLYRVRLDGLELLSQRPSNEAVALGARVSIRVHPGEGVVFA